MFEQIMTYIRKKNPNYTYNFNDFQIMVAGEEVELFWNPDFIISRPTQKELDQITNEEIRVNNKKEAVKCLLNVVENSGDILDPNDGTLALIKGVLSVYYKGVWVEI